MQLLRVWDGIFDLANFELVKVGCSVIVSLVGLEGLQCPLSR